MPSYTVVLSKKAQKQLDEPIIEAIAGLEDNPRPAGYKKLKGSDAYRIRTGNCRIFYDIFDNVLLVDVIGLGHRKDIYE
ncbi:MAG TPA: type II toxin-antitoxin system RelE/ParE family toxin [Saprospiraceae bacterium]|mgnify:FL=1|jgi:mRNA interferase RelE/StbE|nr:type II toxin-antitoxin system RelE/ParE family toxin [Saprospiraceae bacterium]HMT70736.1 type II toxin-antitoxin system RelE/ParE family toxin [Saprospiraceae bacterium]